MTLLGNNSKEKHNFKKKYSRWTSGGVINGYFSPD